MNVNDTMKQLCLDAGCRSAFVLPTHEIPFDKGLRAYCEMNSCGQYGANYACPPGAGEVDDLIAMAKSFAYILVFQTVAELEDSFDFEGMQEAGKNHEAVSGRIFKELQSEYPEGLRLTAGGCSICRVCGAKTGEPCRFPDQAISSLEAYCMNVSELAGKCGMKYINGVNTVTYFSGFLFR